MEPIINAANVNFEYTQSGEQAIKDLSMAVDRGDYVAVLGHNGSGKSTLAKLLNALLTPSSGCVMVCGIDTSIDARAYDVRRHAGMVFQNPDNQIVATVVEEDVAFGLENLGVESHEIRRRVDQALIAVDMYDYAKSAPHMLSGGQKQRVAIAGIIAMRPDIIIFDESTAMLDPSGRKEVLRVADKLRLDGITIVWITHFMEEAVRADRIIVMQDGEMALSGTPREVFSHVDMLKEFGLDVPYITDIACALAGAGVNVKRDTLTVEEMIAQLCQLS